jgi:hypothetical protein
MYECYRFGHPTQQWHGEKKAMVLLRHAKRCD